MDSIIQSVAATSESNKIFEVNTKSLGVADKNSSDFLKIFDNVLNSVKATESATNSTNESLLDGSINDLHTIMIDAAKAELTLGFALQIRNKVIDAYNEVMRMQI